jgi:hypothetical protein
MVMDICRTCTDRDCSFFKDDPTVATIHWYRAPSGAKVFPVAHKINHLNWYSQPWFAGGVGENYGTPEKWNNGFTPPTSTGQNYFGPIEYFQNGAPFDSSVTIPRDTWGLAIGCGTPDCYILEEPDYNPLILQEDGTGILKELCSS